MRLLHSSSGAQTERRADGEALGLWALLTPRQSCSRTGRAGGSPRQLQRQRRPPSPPRPTARNSRRAPERSRAGAAGQDTALLAPRAAGAPGYWGECPYLDSSRLAERERTAAPCRSLPGLRDQQAAALPGFGCSTRAASGRREAVPRFATVSSSPAQRPRTPHAPCFQPGRSPES